MKTDIYKALQDNFITIRVLHKPDSFNEVLFRETIFNIKKIRDTIIKKRNIEEKELLLYCIDTLLEIIKEKNDRKIYDFAKTICDMPEISMGLCNIYSFKEEILTFQKKYGKNYFPDFKKAKPKFQKKAPKNKWEYFSREADETFKLLHPIGYKVLCFVGITVLMLPVFIYIAYTYYFNPAPNEWALMLGFVGSFTIGIGFFNIVAAWIHQYLGHLLTFVCFIGGSALTVISLFLLYN